MSSYRSSASVSDPLTGQLLFYTNGNSFWNRFGEMVDSAYQGPVVEDVLILPLKAYKNRFIVFNFNQIFIVDMNARNGRGLILKKENFILQHSINRMTAVKHCLSESYWVITMNGKSFYAYLVHPDGQIDPPVISPNKGLFNINYSGDFVSSNNGEKLALTYYVPNNNVTYIGPLIFEFNKRCGTFLDGSTILPMQLNWDRPHGVSFSPDDKLLYVAFGYQESQLVQYDLSNPSSFYIAATSPENFNQIACGPDGKLYITTHIGSIPSNKIDAVLNPNVKGSGCNYRENYMRLNGITNFEVPNMVMNHVGTCQENTGYQFEVDAGVCRGQEAHFKVNGQQSGMDSIRWYVNDSSQAGKFYPDFSFSHTYASTGTYHPFAVLFFCGHKDTFFFTIHVSEPQKISLGRDTTLCHGDSITIGKKDIKGKCLWNTGDTTATLNILQAGEYILQNDIRGCKASDSIQIKYHLPLATLLGDDYYICEEEKELVELDAIKGFKQYLWYPTNDTTQWIIVAKKGKYHVVVRDYRGCKGDGNSLVENRCDLQVFLPNAFTPNADGLNDVLNIGTHNETEILIRIYSAWGELLYEGGNGWDGTFQGQLLPQGVYLMTVSANGFIRKQAVEKSYSGLLHIIY